MSEYTIGKDISILEQRINHIEYAITELKKSIEELSGVKSTDTEE
jgi:prefoldin subunit 5